MLRNGDLTRGGITGTLLRFTLPMMAGSLLQQCYNIADTLIVGQCIGADALAAVGSAYTLMVFLISILLGLSIGSGTVFSLHYGAGNHSALRRSIFVSFVLIGAVTCVLNVAVFVWLDPILRLLQVPQDIYGMMRGYLWIIFCGIVFTFIYNFYAAMLRAVGDSVTPLWFLALSVALNIVLDLFFILQLDWGIEGAAIATVMAQGVASAGIMLYTWRKRPELRLPLDGLHPVHRGIRHTHQRAYSGFLHTDIRSEVVGHCLREGVNNHVTERRPYPGWHNGYAVAFHPAYDGGFVAATVL